MLNKKTPILDIALKLQVVMHLNYKSLNHNFFLWKHENSVFLRIFFHQAIKLFHLILGIFCF